MLYLFLPAKIERADASWTASATVIAGSAAVVVVSGEVAEVTGSKVRVIAGIGGIENWVKKLSAPGSVDVRRLLFLLFIRTKSISVFSFEYCEAAESVVVFEEVSVGYSVAKFGEFPNSKKGPIDTKGISVEFWEANSVFCVVSSTEISGTADSVKSAELSKVVS